MWLKSTSVLLGDSLQDWLKYTKLFYVCGCKSAPVQNVFWQFDFPDLGDIMK